MDYILSRISCADSRTSHFWIESHRHADFEDSLPIWISFSMLRDPRFRKGHLHSVMWFAALRELRLDWCRWEGLTTGPSSSVLRHICRTRTGISYYWISKPPTSNHLWMQHIFLASCANKYHCSIPPAVLQCVLRYSQRNWLLKCFISHQFAAYNKRWSCNVVWNIDVTSNNNYTAYQRDVLHRDHTWCHGDVFTQKYHTLLKCISLKAATAHLNNEHRLLIPWSTTCSRSNYNFLNYELKVLHSVCFCLHW